MTDKEEFLKCLKVLGIKYDSFTDESVSGLYNRVALEGSLDGTVDFAFDLNGEYIWFAGS